MVQTISPQNVFVQGQGHIASDMGGETVMLSVRNSKYYNLGEVGGRIWELMAAPASVQQVIDALTDEYAVERAECERQVLEFVSMLAEEGLLVSSDSKGADGEAE